MTRQSSTPIVICLMRGMIASLAARRLVISSMNQIMRAAATRAKMEITKVSLVACINAVMAPAKVIHLSFCWQKYFQMQNTKTASRSTIGNSMM